MKTLAICLIALVSVLPKSDAAEQEGAEGVKYQCLAQTDDKAKRWITVLEGVEIENVSFENLTLEEAISYINNKTLGGKEGGFINLIIREPVKEKNITIKGDALTYAKAVDEICIQSGRSWQIEINDISGAPILVITQKGQQGGAE